MGKKVGKTEKHEVRSYMKMLRPKVYITDSSSFKNLVQQLTGEVVKIKESPNVVLHMQEAAEPALSIEDYAVDYSETSMEMEMEGSADSLQSYNPMFHDHDDDLQGYRDIESWLLDMEAFGHNCYNPITWDQLGTDIKLSLFHYKAKGLPFAD